MDLPLIFGFALVLASLVAANFTTEEPSSTTDTDQTTIFSEDTTILSQQEDPQLADKIFSIEYQIIDEKIPKLIADLINTNSFQYNIASQNLVDILDLKGITYSDLTRLVSELEVDVGRVGLDEVLGTFNLSLIELLKTIVTNIPNSKATTPQILANFGIDTGEYIWITNFENDTSMFNLLSGGNYSEENFAYALGLANMTEEDVLNLLRPQILRHVNSKNLTDLLGFLSQYGLAQQLDVVFNLLEINAGRFYEDPIFCAILSNFSAILNGEDVLAVAVQETELLTILGVHTKWCTLDSFATAHVLGLQNRSWRYEIEDVRNNSLFSVVTVGEDLGGYFRKAEYDEYAPENYVDCQCVGKLEGEFYFAEVRGLTLEGDVLHGNTMGAVCSLGAPLICSNLLYGLSINAVQGSPKFLTFRTQSVPPVFVHDGDIVILITDPVVGESSSGGLSLGVALLILLSCAVVVYVK